MPFVPFSVSILWKIACNHHAIIDKGQTLVNLGTVIVPQTLGSFLLVDEGLQTLIHSTLLPKMVRTSPMCILSGGRGFLSRNLGFVGIERGGECNCEDVAQASVRSVRTNGDPSFHQK